MVDGSRVRKKTGALTPRGQAATTSREPEAGLDLRVDIQTDRVNKFSMIAQNQATSAVARATMADPSLVEVESAGGTITAYQGVGSVQIGVKNFLTSFQNGEIKLDAKTSRLFDFMLLKHTEQPKKTTEIGFTIDEFIVETGRTKSRNNKVEVTKEVALALQSLLNTSSSFVFNGSQCGFNVIQGYAIARGGKVKARLTEDLVSALAVSPRMPYPRALLKINIQKHRNAFYMCRLMVERKNQNYFKANADVYSLSSLVNASAQMTNQVENDKKSNNKAVGFKRFKADMDHLKELEIISAWQFDKAGRKYNAKSLDDDCNVRVVWSDDYPVREKIEAADKSLKDSKEEPKKPTNEVEK